MQFIEGLMVGVHSATRPDEKAVRDFQFAMDRFPLRGA